MTFHQPGWEVAGDVYNVGHDLYLTKSSNAADLRRAVQQVIDDIAADNSLDHKIKTQVLAELSGASSELAQTRPSSAAIQTRLSRVQALLASVGSVVASVATFSDNITKISEWIARFFGS
jgi:hypothetical protein